MTGLLSWGVPEQRIHYEFFGPASAVTERTKVATPKRVAEAAECCTDLEVTFSTSGVRANWNPSFESILDLAEANGLSPDYSCRSGVCQTCVARIEEGEVEYVIEPLDPPDDGSVLICLLQAHDPCGHNTVTDGKERAFMTHDRSIRVAVVGGARTPFTRAGTVFRKYSALDLGVHAVDGLLAKQSLDPQSVGELAFGITVVDARIPHLAKDIVFSSNLPSAVQALTLTNNCITGTSAITAIADSIVAGSAEIGIAGGVESMSNPALLFGKRASRIFLDAAAAKTLGQRLRHFARLRPGDFKPHAPGVKGAVHRLVDGRAHRAHGQGVEDPA